MLDEVQGVLERSGFATGFFVGSLALAAGVLVLFAWPRSLRAPVVPLAGLLLVGAAALALNDQTHLPDGLLLGLALLALAGALAGVIERLHLPPAPALAVLAAPGAWLVSDAAGVDETWPRLLLVATIALGGALVAAADSEYRHLGLGPVLILVSMAGAYATVPDTEQAVIVFGAAVPLAVLGWPWPLASLGRSGASAAVGLLAWVAVTDGSARAGSTVGAIACLGVLLIEPVARGLPNAGEREPAPTATAGAGDGLAAWQTALPVIVLHLLLVIIAARVAGFRSSGLEAAAIAGFALVVAVLVAARWPALLPLTGQRKRG
jgi:hypothetical protein